MVRNDVYATCGFQPVWRALPDDDARDNHNDEKSSNDHVPIYRRDNVPAVNLPRRPHSLAKFPVN
jgi:hypothetical protein